MNEQVLKTLRDCDKVIEVISFSFLCSFFLSHSLAMTSAGKSLNIGQVIFMLHLFLDIWCW